jgi:hypothetical protein
MSVKSDLHILETHLPRLTTLAKFVRGYGIEGKRHLKVVGLWIDRGMHHIKYVKSFLPGGLRENTVYSDIVLHDSIPPLMRFLRELGPFWEDDCGGILDALLILAPHIEPFPLNTDFCYHLYEGTYCDCTMCLLDRKDRDLDRGGNLRSPLYSDRLHKLKRVRVKTRNDEIERVSIKRK